MKFWLLSIVAVVVSSQAPNAWAFDHQKCFKTETGPAWFRKYDFQYAGPWWITSRQSGKESSLTVVANSSIQQSTMSVDPGVTTGNYTSSGQFTSSTGDCAWTGQNERKRQREEFIVENLDELKHDIAFGRGEHLDALAYLSGCASDVDFRFAATMQDNFASMRFAGLGNGDFSDSVDAVLRRDPRLARQCEDVM